MLNANILPGLFLIFLLFTLSSGLTPPAPEPEAADGPSSPTNCLVSMLNVSDCLSYVQVGSTETTPEAACCPELAWMAQSSPECVCNLLGGGASPRFGVKLDKLRAEELSSICGVKAPSPSLCSGPSSYCSSQSIIFSLLGQWFFVSLPLGIFSVENTPPQRSVYQWGSTLFFSLKRLQPFFFLLRVNESVHTDI
ncbi:unnamed protein product [Eruca vesicaria subsp. sativa]|uniref:Bifunctional inhibitor/plant lipid transfer protein/seed storage helical domain-containing protein n=1 Tax=Eruca vesicaria subsp. sativa TaxID=29727 RepID=A0ABC8M5Q3_ERUVS|nr:unnamed protein product [Eruca vesicaria subsp. sativa]